MLVSIGLVELSNALGDLCFEIRGEFVECLGGVDFSLVLEMALAFFLDEFWVHLGLCNPREIHRALDDDVKHTRRVAIVEKE
jgi:hypothetical protein